MPLADLPQTNKQHAVPQNIMDVEFKLIGDLTMRQFAYLMFCGGMAYVSSVAVVGLFKWPLVIFFTLLGLGLAFVPIQERGLDEWIANFFRAIYMPTQRLWQKEAQIPSAFLYENLAVVRQELITLAPTSSRRKLEEFLEYHSKSEKEDPLDIPEKEYLRKVQEAFADVVPASANVAVALEEPEVYVNPEVSGTFQDVSPEEPPLERPDEEPGDSLIQEVYAPSSSAPVSSVLPQIEFPQEVTQPLVTSPLPSVNPTQSISTQQAQQPMVGAIPTTTSTSAQPVPVATETPPRIVTKPKPQQQPQRPAQRKVTATLRPMTPDMHSGRRFVNLVPKSGELVLPIRGERVIRTTEQIDIEDDIQEKAEKLQQLLSQIRSNNLAQPKEQNTPSPKLEDRKLEVAKTTHLEETPSTSSTIQPVQEVDNQAADLANMLKTENERLTNEISKLEESKQTSLDQTDAQKKEDQIKRLEAEKRRTQTDYESLQKQLLALQDKLKEQSGSVVVSSADSSVKPVYSRIQPLTTKPSVVSGIVHLADGSLLEGVLIIVKSSQGEAVRAIKSNSLGQFILSTPLLNGIYTLEVSSPNNKALSFDIISVEVKGEVIPPIEIIGKQ